MNKSDERLEIYNTLTEDDARRFEIIDRFLKLSDRFSPKSIKRKKRSLMFLLLVCAVLLAASLASKDIKTIGMGVLVTAALLFLWYITNLHLNNNYFPELERTVSIIENDGLDAVCEALDRASSIGRSDAYTDGKYIFVQGKAMCRAENITDVYIRTDTHGRSTVYYAAASVADESGAHDIDLVRLTGMGTYNNKQFVELKERIFMLKITADHNDTGVEK